MERNAAGDRARLGVVLEAAKAFPAAADVATVVAGGSGAAGEANGQGAGECSNETGREGEGPRECNKACLALGT